ncbi:uncharacterized protein LOC112552127 [Alligator sinensis]|uniref:Uncharacterized protein LOC112552127 n=1 Tax=Alligator sinensis TaxID=38654 RepID=A0A3Q0HQ54_ALLSI|nr:uncharacterized protein LOC112552127 [Alligator sinensis]
MDEEATLLASSPVPQGDGISLISESAFMDSATCNPQECIECAIANGMKSLVSVAKQLQHEGFGTQVAELIKCAFKKLRAAKELAESKQNAADSHNQMFLAEQQNLEEEKKQKKKDLSLLELNLEYNKEMVKMHEDMEKTANKHLEKLQKELNSVKKNEKLEIYIRNFFIVFLPLYILIVSVQTVHEALHITEDTQFSISLSVVAGICQASVYMTHMMVKELENVIQYYTSKVYEYKQQVNEYKKKEKEIQKEKEKCEKTNDQKATLSAHQTHKLDMYVSSLRVVVELLADPTNSSFECWSILQKVYCRLLPLVGEKEDTPKREELVQKLESIVRKFVENHRAIKGKN